jgi:hypothetical protein
MKYHKQAHRENGAMDIHRSIIQLHKELICGLGVVVMLVIPVTWEAQMGELWLKASLGKMLMRSYFKNQARCGSVHL